MSTDLETAFGLADHIERRRQVISAGLDATVRARKGQYFTPAPAAEFIVGQLELPENGVWRVLDPGAGVGSLAGALVARVLWERPGLAIHITACEMDRGLLAPLRATLEDCVAAADAVGGVVRFEIVDRDFIAWAADLAAFGGGELFDAVIMNPPYRKLGRGTEERHQVATVATDVSNLYTAFLALAVPLLAHGGQLTAITPRSFTSGPYFKSFRRFFLDRMDLRGLHIYTSRTTVFADTDVLQENLILTARRSDTPDRPPVIISTSDGHDDEPRVRTVPFTQVVHPEDGEKFWHIDLDQDDDRLAALLAALPATLADLGLAVSTGRVVDFRSSAHLHTDPGPGDVPLIYPLHMNKGRITWPVPGARKPNAITLNAATSKLTFPAGHYPVVKRLSAKEELRKVVAALFDPAEVPCEAIGFENHVNVLHANGRGLDPRVARGLTLWLNSKVVDSLVRRFNGHTQVNATDLRILRYPAASELAALGAAWGQGDLPTQEKIDALVAANVSACSPMLTDVTDSLLIESAQDPRQRRIAEARDLLRRLDFDDERCNERSAQVLLALAALRPEDPWPKAAPPLLRTVEIMAWIRDHYGTDYKPNTRETIRRQTLHQFVEAGLVVYNPDDPQRPVNSPKACYQLEPAALDVMRAYPGDQFDALLAGYRRDLPGLRELRAAERHLHRLPVTLLDGTHVTLSPGGQNILIRQAIEEFCPVYTPGGVVLYLGDADDKWSIFEQKRLADLGVHVDSHGKMPDIVIHLPDRNWLVLMEAASSHGPVDGKRHGELKELFKDSKAGLVFISCLPSRTELRKYLKEIAWETDVWCADNPTHLIHFDGDRFLGPYDSDDKC